MKLVKFIVAILSFTSSISVLAYSESQQYTPESIKLLNQLQGQIKATLLAVSDNERKAGNNMNNFHYSLSVPAEEQSYLGLVLDLNNVDNSYEVLSITPGSIADKLGIKSKDRILKINDIQINDSTRAATVRLLNNLKPNDILNLTVNSNNVERELSTKLVGHFIPEIWLELGANNDLKLMESMRASNIQNASCGTVSVYIDPPKAKDIYPATRQKVDDDHLKRNRSTYRLPVGKHTILLHEYIDIKNLTIRVRSRAKPIEIDVKENTTYHIGAKYNRDKGLKIHKGGYWTPVVWKISEKECSL